MRASPSAGEGPEPGNDTPTVRREEARRPLRPTRHQAMANAPSTYIQHYRSLLRLGAPIVIGQVGTVATGFADSLMIGRHSMEELAAASFVASMFILLMILSLGFSLGLTPTVGAMAGRSETGRIGEFIGNGLLANTVIAAILAAVASALYLNIHRLGQPAELLPLMRDYLLANILSIPFVCWFNSLKQFYDGIAETRVPMAVILGGNVMNVLGNWALIYGRLGLPEMGLLGAGIATLASRAAMLIALAAIFLAARRYRPYLEGLRKGRPNRKDILLACSLGVPISLQLGMETSAFSLSSIFVGWIGVTALAAHQVMMTVAQVLYMVYIGMAAAIAVRVSHFHGRGEVLQAERAAHSGFHVIMALAVTLSVPVFLLRGRFGYWFTPDDDVAALASLVAVPLIAYQFGDGLQYAYANALRGIACVRPMIWMAFVAYFVVSLPLGYLLGIRLGHGLPGVWWAFPACLLTAGTLYFLRFRKEIGRMRGKDGTRGL